MSSPQRHSQYPGLETGFNVLDTELLAEKASALGNAERRVVAAMAALRAFDATPRTDADRLIFVQAAAHEVWCFFVQRELCGLRDQRAVIRDMAIPGEVLVRLGERPMQHASG